MYVRGKKPKMERKWRRDLLFILFVTVISLVLSDVKDALDNMNAINQHFVHMHLFGL
jgi:hypothetical protein